MGRSRDGREERTLETIDDDLIQWRGEVDAAASHACSLDEFVEGTKGCAIRPDVNPWPWVTPSRQQYTRDQLEKYNTTTPGGKQVNYLDAAYSLRLARVMVDGLEAERLSLITAKHAQLLELDMRAQSASPTDVGVETMVRTNQPLVHRQQAQTDVEILGGGLAQVTVRVH